jgi:uncharacterized membrane protein YdfJ with MMPL/SSD domain
VIAGWVVAVPAVALIANAAGEKTSDNLSLPGTGSTSAQNLLKEDDDPHKAVVDGLATTGRVITSAALIMVCVFSSFVLNGNAVVKEFGVGLAVAIASTRRSSAAWPCRRSWRSWATGPGGCRSGSTASSPR